MAAVVQSLQLDVEQSEGMILKTELSQRKRVLRRLGYLEANGVVTRKGHVCSLQSSPSLQGHAQCMIQHACCSVRMF
jgi:hypothetical protein